MKRLVILIAGLLLMGNAAIAQPLLVQDKNFDNFSTIKVEDKFVVKLVHSDSYAAKISSDERIAAYVQAYVKNGTLYLLLDEKGYTPELKKQLRQRGAAEPVLEVEIYMPTFNSLILSDKTSLVSCGDFQSESFTLTVSDNARIDQLNITCSTAEFNVSRNANVVAAMNVASKMYVNTSNSSTVNMTQTGGNTYINMTGSSNLSLTAEIQTLEIVAEASSEVHINGTADFMKVEASNLSKTDVELLDVEDADVIMTGSSKCHVNVSENLKVNLTGGSMLTFKRSPSFEVERIVNSTLIKSDDPKRK